MIFVGLDPGVTGGMASINEYGRIEDCREFEDWRTSAAFLKVAKEKGEGSCLVLLEHAQSMSQQGVVGVFNYGANFGGWEALLQAIGLPYILVKSQKWQKYILGVIPKGESKPRAFAYVSKRFPDITFKKSRDSGIIDAICMALYLKDNH